MIKILLIIIFPILLFSKGVIIPLYIQPQNAQKELNKIIELKKRFNDKNFILILNPNNGEVFFEDKEYSKVVKKLDENNITVVGYIYTSYGKRELKNIYQNILNWTKFYKRWGLDGFFIDEVSCKQEFREYYKKISLFLKSRGYKTVILNPGTSCKKSFYDFSTLVVTFEGRRLYKVPKTSNKKAALFYCVKSFKDYKNLIKYFDYIYITDDNLPNPWDSLSIYLEKILKEQ